jgi:16S rRNA pseudouridine516 synthase
MAYRLDAFLAHRGFGSRTHVRGMIRRGRVTIAGVVCHDQGEHVAEREVRVDGELVAVGATSATLLLHKPLGVACSHDEREAPLLEELIPAEFRHLALEPAGRLDRDTSGLLVVTSEGDLIHLLTNPRRHLPKRYRIGYRGTLSSHAVERCAKGSVMEGDPRPTLPAALTLEAPAGGLERATLVLEEGRYHQVRKMIAALGGEVVTLHRDRIGGLDLPAELAPGQARVIAPAEQELLLSGSAR